MKWFKSVIQQLYFKQEKNLALYDLPTLAYNRNWWEHIGISKYSQKACYITMIDVNGLKLINDTKGHVEGDKIIKMVAASLHKIFKGQDLVRYGGDEFVLITEFNPQRLISMALEDCNQLFSYGYKLKYANDNLEFILTLADKEMERMKQMSQQERR